MSDEQKEKIKPTTLKMKGCSSSSSRDGGGGCSSALTFPTWCVEHVSLA